MDPARITQETLDLIKNHVARNIGELMPNLAKAQAYNQSFGLVWYDLEPSAKLLYPVN